MKTIACLLATAGLAAAQAGCNLMPRVTQFQAACCSHPGDNCDANGFPATGSCTDTCSDAFLEFYADCGAALLATAGSNAASMSGSFEQMVQDCSTGTGASGEVSHTFLSDHIDTCTNVAIGKTASQSSTRQAGGEAQRAIDGDTNGVFTGNSCTHTDPKHEQGTATWWQVDLGAVFTIRAVQISNRADCCADRLDGAAITVSMTPDYTLAINPDCGHITVEGSSEVEISTCGHDGHALGQYVTVSKIDKSILSLCEVAVYAQCNDAAVPPPPPLPQTEFVSGCPNLVAGATATESSIGWGGDAMRAIDGASSSSYGDASCINTQNGEQEWWQVDLGRVQTIGSVVITNRADCCADRIVGATVYVSTLPDFTDDLATSTTNDVRTSCGSPSEGTGLIGLECPPRTYGRYITVTKENDFINFCEFQAYALRECATEVGATMSAPFQLTSGCTSQSSCETLGWAAGPGSPNVCAKSEVSADFVPQDVSYIGCFADNTGGLRDMTGPDTTVISTGVGAVAECEETCTGFQYFGLQWTDQCFCGNTYGNQGAGTDCDADGDTSSGYADQCGDGVSGTCGNTNAVYQIASLGAAACHTTDAGAGFAAADEICRNAGARLCTIEELVAGETRGSGCGYDAQQVYSSSSCGTGALAVIGTGQGDTTCHDTLSDDLAVRCCGDAVVVPCADSEDGGGHTAEHPTEMCLTNALSLIWDGGTVRRTGNPLFGTDEVHVPELANLAATVPEPANGCGAITSDLTGKVAVIVRGDCTFVEKVLNAQHAGAVAVVIYNNVDGNVNMAGEEPEITIPAIMLQQTDGQALAAAIAAAPSSTMVSLDCQDPGRGNMNLVETLVSLPGTFSTLVAAVTAAGLVPTLSGPGPFTVFAPTNDAFAALGQSTIDSLLADPTGQLATILTYHVAAGHVLSTQLYNGEQIRTVQGASITVTIDGDGVHLNGVATVRQADVECSNGVAHIIDAVITPPAGGRGGGHRRMEADDEYALL